MKKIGIITFHTALNYGAIMQTYGLQTFLCELGFQNEIINYRCEFIDKCYSPFFVADGNYLNSIMRGLLFGGVIRKRRKRFEKFIRDNLILSREYLESASIEKDRDNYSYFISGSDQVWSPISSNFDKTYFLPFAKDGQKLSYAASIGASTLNAEVKNEIGERLKGFKCLSVREESAKDLLTGIDSDRDILVHIDPTLLLSKVKWLALVNKRTIQEDYVLIFNVEKPINDVAFAKNYAKKHSLKVVYINDRALRKDLEITYVEAPAPDQFLTLFANAKTIITNSFHGMVFSIIFNKDFYVELENKKQRNIRVEGLLKELGIDNREVEGTEPFYGGIIDWNSVDEILSKQREKSKAYFKKYLV